VHDVRYLVPLDDVEQARPVQNVASFEINVVDNVEDKPVVPVPGEDNRAVPLTDEFPAGLGADYAHAAGNKNLHRTTPYERSY
jgi:hypothetical protein